MAAELEASGKYAGTFLADLGDSAGVVGLVAAVERQLPAVDSVALVAGVDVLTGAAATWPFEKKLAALLQVDVVATMQMVRSLGRFMAEREGGSIVTIGWDQAATGME